MAEKIDISDPIVQVLISRNKKIAQEKLKRLEKFQSINNILEHLADAKPKDREAFLRWWKTDKAAKGLGRTKNNDFEIYIEMQGERKAFEKKYNKKFGGWKSFLENYFDKKHPEMSRTDADKRIKTLENSISKANKIIKAAEKLY